MQEQDNKIDMTVRDATPLFALGCAPRKARVPAHGAGKRETAGARAHTPPQPLAMWVAWGTLATFYVHRFPEPGK